MSMVLRILVSSPHELPFLRLNILESMRKVDRILVCEADFTHTGQIRGFIFDQLIKELSEGERAKVEYLPMKLGHLIDWNRKDGDLYHHIEQLIRNQFTEETTIGEKDIVVAVDADEIIYEETYDLIRKKLNSKFVIHPKSLRLKLNQFFYRLDYHWFNCSFTSPVAANARYFLEKGKTAQWRDEGKVLSAFAGCHFSWIMDIEQMVRKLETYAHNDIYGKYANKELLEDAIKNREYPFDRKVNFKINKIERSSLLYPNHFREVFDDNHTWFSN